MSSWRMVFYVTAFVAISTYIVYQIWGTGDVSLYFKQCKFFPIYYQIFPLVSKLSTSCLSTLPNFSLCRFQTAGFPPFFIPFISIEFAIFKKKTCTFTDSVVELHERARKCDRTGGTHDGQAIHKRFSISKERHEFRQRRLKLDPERNYYFDVCHR